MNLLKYLGAAGRMIVNIDFGASHGSAGVNPIKLRKDYFLNDVAKQHDHDYSQVDWDVGTKYVDYMLLQNGLEAAGKDEKKRAEVYTAYSIARTYGRFRWLLAKAGIEW